MCLCSRCIEKAGGLEYPSAPPQYPPVVRIQSTGIEFAAGLVTPSPQIANARVVINCDGLVIKDTMGDTPRRATDDELRQAKTI